jgi:hypothetical protein
VEQKEIKKIIEYLTNQISPCFWGSIEITIKDGKPTYFKKIEGTKLDDN